MMTDNGPHLVSKFVTALWASMGTKLAIFTEYHLQTNGQTEMFNKTLVTRLRRYIDERRTGQDSYV